MHLTGKTTVAKIYGQLLIEMGLLSNGEVIVKNLSDFRGSVLGSSEKNTQDILCALNGNVLVIDEAYALCTSNGLNGTSDPYGTAVIDTLVEQIQARPGDDCAVVMLGYRKEIENMFKNVNPGLSRRFQLELLLISDEAFIDWAARSHSSISPCILLEPVLATVIATGLDLSTNLLATSKLISSSSCKPDLVTTWLLSSYVLLVECSSC